MNKHYAVADLHGMYTLWRNVLKELDDTDTLYILGDCADRGPRGWDIIKEALVDPCINYIRGNHDQMLIDACLRPWDYEATSLWYWNGGSVTHEAIMADPDYEKYVDQLAKTEHSACYHNTNGQIIHLTHAGYTLHEDDEIPLNEDLLWDRDHITDKKWPKSKEKEFIIHGHTPIISSYWKSLNIEVDKANPKIIKYCNNHKICIDLGAVFTNITVILDLDTLLPIYIKGD